MSKPLAIDLFCGLGGWAEGFLAEGYDVIGFDIERRPYPAQLVLQDVLTLDGAQFKGSTVIVASPPCQAYSYRAMPWKRAKALPPPDNTLFEACFRIQREASEAAGRYIPMVVENVRGAVKWVGPAQGKFGSYYLWGDVPALLPVTQRGGQKFNPDGTPHGPGSWFAVADSKNRGASGVKVPSFRFDGSGGSFQNASVRRTNKGNGARFTSRDSSKRAARKHASALIAKIPFPLAQHVARVYKGENEIPTGTRGRRYQAGRHAGVAALASVGTGSTQGPASHSARASKAGDGDANNRRPEIPPGLHGRGEAGGGYTRAVIP